MEIEMKLKLRPADAERLRAHPALTQYVVAEPAEHSHIDTYYDTPEHELWQHGLTLRVRASRESYVQTVKTDDGPSAALHSRGEWECALDDGQVQPQLLASEIRPTSLANLVSSPAIIARLQPIFTVTTRRTTWDVRLAEGEQMECALDTGEVQAGKRRAGTAELELELKKGTPNRLFDFALALHRAIPLQLANDSKAARGYALLGAAKPAAVKATPVRLRSKMTLGQTFQSIALNCLQQIEANTAGVLDKDAESLHQMRVGLRRLRALLDMFDALISPPQDIDEGLNWLAGDLGATRDWDVLADSTLSRIHGIDPSALRDAAHAKAAKLHEVMLKTLHAPRFTDLMLVINGWLRSNRWLEEAPDAGQSALAQPAARAALPLLRKAERRLSKRIAALDTQDAPARHRVRIAAKKARYGAEFFRDLLDKKNVKSYVTRLTALQDRLGLLNDMAVADHLLPELQHGSSEHARAAGFARGYLFAAAEADAEALDAALKAVAKQRMTK